MGWTDPIRGLSHQGPIVDCDDQGQSQVARASLVEDVDGSTIRALQAYKHWAKDPAWLGDPRGAERLLEDMDRPERFGDDQQEHMLTAMSRIIYHLRRQKTESWREYFAKWDNAIRKVQQHKIVPPPEYEGFLMMNGLQLTESDTKALVELHPRLHQAQFHQELVEKE